LTAPPNSGAAWSGPYQTQSALIRLTGNLTASCAVTIPRAGFFIFENLCTSGGGAHPPLAGSIAGTFVVTLQSSSPGNVIGLPPGRKIHVFCDGTNVDFVNLENPGTQVDWTGLTAMPAWVTACTVQPYLLRDGANYAIGSYPALYSMLGNQFGGTAGLNFNTPDSRQRVDVAYNGTVGRLTAAGSGVQGNVMGSAGGNQLFQQHTHVDAGHAHGVGAFDLAGASAVLITFGGGSGPISVPDSPGGITVATGFANIEASGGGFSQNVQPTIVSFLAVIKT
jgi:microcystin-dependent protein